MTKDKAILLAVHVCVALALGFGMKYAVVPHDLGVGAIGALLGALSPSTIGIGKKKK